MDILLTLGEEYWTPFGTAVLRITSFYFGAASFVCMLQFSLRIIFPNVSKRSFFEHASLIASLLFFVGVTSYGVSTGFSHQWLILSQVLMRYLLSFPGAILTAIGFWKQRRLLDIQSLSSYHVDRSLMAMAAIFAFYAVFAGLIVPSTFFFPASLLNYDAFKGAVWAASSIFSHSMCGISGLFYHWYSEYL